MAATPAIVAASPVVVIPAPTRMFIELPLPNTLVEALHARHAELVNDHARMRISAPTFEAWVEQRLTDVAYGDGRPHPATAR